MYTEKERAKLLIQAATVVSTYPEVEGIVQVGSGVEGFLDEYSDIDLIFSTFTSQQVPILRARMDKLFSDALYIRQVDLEQGLFLYVFLKNGLEFDLVLMPTSALQVRSAHWKILTDKTGQVLSRMHSSQLEGLERQTFRDTLLDWEFEIVYAMRSILFEIERGNFLYVMSRMDFVRDKLVRLQCYYEKKEQHQFGSRLSAAFAGDLPALLRAAADAGVCPAAALPVFKAAQRQPPVGNRQSSAGYFKGVMKEE